VNGARTVSPRKLTKTTLAETADFTVERVDCRCGASGWSGPEPSLRYRIVFVRSGCFRRRMNGSETFVDPTVVYFERPADEQQISHPGRGDSCTALYLSDVLLASVWGGELELPDEPVPTDATTDLTHRLLLPTLSHGERVDVEEAVVSLVASRRGLSTGAGRGGATDNRAGRSESSRPRVRHSSKNRTSA
jgi:hypothetical protein